MTQERRTALQARIDALPAGNITYKTINGIRYPYLQWQENGKQRGRRVKEAELDALHAGIGERKRLQALLKAAPQAAETAYDLHLTASSRIREDLKAYLSSLCCPSASAIASGSFMRFSMAKAPTRFSFCTACAAREKPP